MKLRLMNISGLTIRQDTLTAFLGVFDKPAPTGLPENSITVQLSREGLLDMSLRQIEALAIERARHLAGSPEA